MRTKNYIRIITSSSILQIAIVISGLILPRLIIKYYGSEINGLVLSIKQIITYFSFVSLGLGAASSTALYEPLEEKNYEKINSILSATRIFFIKTGYIFSVLVLILTFTYPLIVSSTLTNLNVALIVLILGLGGVLEYIIITKYRILLIADQKNNIVSKITTQGVIINTIISVVLIYLESPIVLIQIVTVTVYMLRLLLTQKYVLEHYPKINFRHTPDFALVPNRKNAFLYQLPNMAMTYTPVLIITFFLSLKKVSIYSIYNMIFSSLAMIVGVFSAGVNGIFGNIYAKKDEVLLKNSFKEFTFIYRIISFSIFVSAAVLTIPFLKIYIDSYDSSDYLVTPLVYGFGLFGLLRIIRIPYVIVIEIAGHFKENMVLNYIEILIMIIVSIALLNKYDLVGILLASSFSAFFRTLSYVLYCKKIIKSMNLFKEILNYIFNFSISILLYYIFFKFIVHSNSNSIIIWLFDSIIIFTISVLSLSIVNLLIDYNSFVKITRRIIHFLYKKKNFESNS